MAKENQAALDEKDLEITPQARHRQKLVQEDEARKKAKAVVSQHVEIISDHQHPKGGKVRLVKRMNNGNVHRLYIGRERQVKDVILSYQKQGLKVLR